MSHMGPFSRVALSLIALIPGVLATEPWDTPFAADTGAVVSAAKSVTESSDSPVVMLLSEYDCSIDSKGRATTTVRKVYRILKEDAVDEWASVEQGYQPWHEDKPEMRARVLEANGAVHILDGKTIADAPGRQLDQQIFSDDRLIRAPLPAAAVGAVVEYEIVTRDHAPLFDAGVTRKIVLMDSIPTLRFHATIEAAGAVLKTAAQSIPDSALTRRQTKSTTRVECDWGPLEARKNVEFNLPPELSPYPYLAFSTGTTWQAIASRYSGIVDGQIGISDLKALLNGIDLKGTAREVAARLTAELHRDVRYTGVEFGEAAIVPGPPPQTLTRKYGDCKDKSTLLVAMLRAAGLPAHVALLESGYGSDVNPTLPGMGMFDHAIVYVASDPPLWIDATAADTRAGTLPMADQGRLALIAANDSRELVKTPESTSKDNFERHTIDIQIPNYGSGDVREKIEVGGEMDSEMRAGFNVTGKQLKEQLEKYVKQTYFGKLGAYHVSDHDDFQGEFQYSVEAKRAVAATATGDSASIGTYPFVLFDRLPFALKSQDAGNSEETVKDRKDDFLLTIPYQMEYRYRFHLPLLFKLAKTPESETLKIGSTVYERKFSTQPDGVVEVVLRFDSGKRRLNAAEFKALRAGLKKYSARTPEMVGFVSDAAQMIALGEPGKAIAAMRESVSRHDLDANAHIGLSRMLISVGLGGPALAEAQRAVRLDPKSSLAWQSLAWAYQFDTFGRRFEGNWNRLQAEAAFRKALSIEPDDPIAQIDLAVLLEHNNKGVRYGEGARLGEAIDLYRQSAKQIASPEFQKNLIAALFRANRLDEAQEEAKKSSADVQLNMSGIMISLREGVASAILKIQGQVADPTERARYLASVGFSLLQIRRYDLAIPLLRAAARVSDAPGAQDQVERIAQMKRWEDAPFPLSDPRRAPQEFLRLALQGDWSSDHARDLLSKKDDPLLWNAAELRRGVAAALPRGFDQILGGDALIDAALSLINLDKEGDDSNGYRVAAKTGYAGNDYIAYVVLEDKYRLVRNIGAVVVERLARHDIKGAQQWLDWAVKDATPAPDGTGFPAVRSLWSGVLPETRGVTAITLAAASIEGSLTGSPQAIQILKMARAKAANDLERSQIDKALCESYSAAQNWDKLLAAGQRLAASKVFFEEGFRYEIRAARRMRNWQALEAAARARLKASPRNVTALKGVALSRIYLGDSAGAAEWVQKVKDFEFAGADEREFAAWAAMLGGTASRDTIADLKKENQNGVRVTSTEYDYTLALVSATVGLLDDALQELQLGMKNQNYDALPPTAWVAFAKICQIDGFPVEASKALQHALSMQNDSDDVSRWALELARRWDSPGAPKSSSLAGRN